MKAEGVLITGTTSGLGLALLAHHATREKNVIAVNRRPVPELAARYPSVRFEQVDVRSEADVAALLTRLVEGQVLPRVFFLNAGINRIDNDTDFDLGAFRDVIDTNLYGVLNFVGPLTRLPRGAEPLHVVAVSSLASYVGNPYGLGYHTSKRALTACFDVWSRMYEGTDLVFQQVMLGPVRTPMFTMTARLPPWMGRVREAFTADLEGTVRALARFAETRRRKLFHPWSAALLFLGLWCAQRLVPGLFRGRTSLGGVARRPRGGP